MDHFDTIVIGAGIAGLTTARLLARSGRNVVVLEARERIGGRVLTDRSHGLITDLGASWIHGVTGSPVAAAAAAFGMPMMEFTVGGYQPASRPIAYYGPSGERLSDAAVRRFVDDLDAIDVALARVIADSKADASYRDVTETALDAQRWDHERALRVREFLEHRAEEQYGVQRDQLAAHGLDDDSIDGDEVVFPDGYDELAARLATGLDIRLGHVVSRVAWSAHGATVSSGSTTATSDDVVVTVPVGVLRSEDFAIEPALPEPQASALRRLKMNAFEKVVLRFPTKFWDDGVYAIRQQGPEGSWWHSWYDLTRLHGTPTLLTFLSGEAAVQTRGWSDDRIAESALAQLRRLYGARVEQPTQVHVTAWQDDPFARGSYAYMTVGSNTSDHDDLANPVGGVLHIAGEATWTDDPATVPAAMLSGHRAASRILQREIPIDDLWTEG
ncbi:flavin monoamine oxidase family protein [Microbacterium sp. I2]|uniref:flavin monoamine oxidase family protein n=1 Tax=Microbacterium sp. I2 TaxID=3391826 RepID=UPI003ED8A0D2